MMIMRGRRSTIRLAFFSDDFLESRVVNIYILVMLFPTCELLLFV